MIKIDKGKTEMEGTRAILSREISCFFKCINIFCDKGETKQTTELLEELIVCDEELFKEFCQMAVRLNEAHKRVLEREKKVKEIFNDRTDD